MATRLCDRAGNLCGSCQRGSDLNRNFAPARVQGSNPVPVDFHRNRSLEKTHGNRQALLFANFNQKPFEPAKGPSAIRTRCPTSRNG